MSNETFSELQERIARAIHQDRINNDEDVVSFDELFGDAKELLWRQGFVAANEIMPLTREEIAQYETLVDAASCEISLSGEALQRAYEATRDRTHPAFDVLLAEQESVERLGKVRTRLQTAIDGAVARAAVESPDMDPMSVFKTWRIKFEAAYRYRYDRHRDVVWCMKDFQREATNGN